MRLLTRGVLAALLATAISVSSAFASGRLTVRFDSTGGQDTLTVQEVGGDWNGTLTCSGPGPVCPEDGVFVVSGGSTGSVITVQIGLSITNVIRMTSFMNGAPSGTTYQVAQITPLFTGYPLELSVTPKKNGGLVYDGVAGPFDDVSGKTDDSKLVLYWGKSKLTLERDTPGTCIGRVNSPGRGEVELSCETSGALLDVFFKPMDPQNSPLTGPDAIVAVLFNLLLR